MLKVETREPELRFFEDFREGQELPTVTRGPMMVGHQVRWAGACDNYESEFHHDEYVAKAQGLPGIILSGPLLASWLLTTVVQWTGRGARLVRFADQNRAEHDTQRKTASTSRPLGRRDGARFPIRRCA